MMAGETAQQVLLRLLHNGDAADRCYSAQALGHLLDPTSVPTLAECLQDEDIDVCVDAADALGRIGCRIGSEDAVPILIDALSEIPDGEVARALTEALARSSDPRAIDTLIAVASERPAHLDWGDGWDHWWDMQLIAVEALGRHRATSAIPALRAILLGEEATDIEEQVLHALARIGGVGWDAITERLQNGSAQTRRRAARALASSSSDTAARILGRALQDADPQVRIAAVESLANLQAGSYLGALMLLLRDPNQEVRAAAAQAAPELAREAGAESLLEELVPMLDDPSPFVVRTALGVLESRLRSGQVPAEMAHKVLALLDSEDGEIAALAAALAGRAEADDAAARLSGVLQDAGRPVPVRRQAAIALGLRRPSGAAVLDALALAVLDSEQPVRLGALSALMSLEGAGDGEREPLELVLDALAGRPQAPASAGGEAGPDQSKTRSQVVAFQPDVPDRLPGEAPSPEPATAREIPVESSKIPAPEEEISLPESPEGTLGLPPEKAASSTLDAIVMDNVEATLLFAEGAEDRLSLETSDPQLKPFFDTLDANARVASMLFPERRVEVALDVRRLSARVLADSDDPRTVEGLLEALSDEDAQVRTNAASSLEAIANRNPQGPALVNATGALIARLGIGEEGQGAACARALAHLGNRAATEPLLAALEHEDADLRIASAGALAELALNGADPEAAGHMVPVEQPLEAVAEALIDLLDDAEPGVRLAAAGALARLSGSSTLNGTRPQAVQHLIDAAYAGEGQQARAMGRALRCFGAAAEQPLLDRLAACADSGERRFAIEMLDELLRPEAAQTT